MSTEKTINDLIAVSEFVYLIKDKPVTQKGGLDLPEPSIKSPNTGKIISVGNLVQDKNIRKGKTAIFSKQVGTEIEILDSEITVLNGNTQIHGVL
jgi:co-chaperonin GroES (HSP10)